jgi:hypothetical protein
MDLTFNWSSRRRWCACSVLAVAGGCAAPFSTSYLSGSRQQEAALATAAANDPATVANDPKAIALRKANGEEPASPEEALAGVLGELQEIGAIDQAAQQELMADLKAAKPEHYELIVGQFKAALAYRQQLERREHDEETPLATDEHEVHVAPSTAATRAQLASRAARRADAEPVVEPTRRAVEPPADHHVAETTPTTREAPVTAATVLVAEGRDRELRQATALTSPLTGGDWHETLETAIAELEHAVQPKPTTIAELHDHLRLRTLQLVAGHEEEAYRPLPGASPAQQDYWSKQLFAMAAYLKSNGPADEKQRAAAALVHLDEARAALAQLATLQIRNMAFVKSVDGFGDYEPLKHAEFQPGDPVTLYAEVENFGSTSAAAGYETSLGTSYQVVDSTGRRVEGAQFPDVADVCRGRRRDFHLQYGVTLPTKIVAGEYRLELTITDHHTGKIGQATLPFEIVGSK